MIDWKRKCSNIVISGNFVITIEFILMKINTQLIIEYKYIFLHELIIRPTPLQVHIVLQKQQAVYMYHQRGRRAKRHARKAHSCLSD